MISMEVLIQFKIKEAVDRISRKLFFLCFYASVVLNKLSFETWSEDSNELGHSLIEP